MAIPIAILALASLLSQTDAAQEPAPAPAGAAFSKAQLEQLVAPIALYPDALLSQVLMASTYPLEIVEAARWAQQNPKLPGDQLESALRAQTWDPSVKSLCGFTDVLNRMNDNLDWTQDLGDAFLGQRAALFDAVQTMRRNASDAGTLQSGDQVSVAQQDDGTIAIQQTDPDVVYVPVYYPTAVYGGWYYPHWYYPALYPAVPAGGVRYGFAAGVVWGRAMWGGCRWGAGHGDVYIDADRRNAFAQRTSVDAQRSRVEKAADGRAAWSHDPAHRRNVGYGNADVARRYGAAAGEARVSRDQARGFGDRAAGPLPSADRGAAVPRATSSVTLGVGSSSFTGASSAAYDRASSARGAVSRGSYGARGGARMGGGRR